MAVDLQFYIAGAIGPTRDIIYSSGIINELHAEFLFVKTKEAVAYFEDPSSVSILQGKQTGAPIVFGPNANPSFETIVATDGQQFQIGKVTIMVLHTPGHTMESTTYLLRDAEGKDHAIFSGDTLFLGDVRKTRFSSESCGHDARRLSGHSVMKILPDVLDRGTTALSPDAFETAANETGALVLDVRHQNEFVKGHIPRSIFIGLNGDFAPWVGALIADIKQPILLVTPDGKEEETITRLSRVGFDGTIGYLDGSFDAWLKANKEVDTITSHTAEMVTNGD
ncbi:Hydroxyacylglutathione hydrolase, mitochondrial [Nymphon striatum]|nr:Hydroxyacylglutathione hydrolase, mitochondrial [Nymphon striatum]